MISFSDCRMPENKVLRRNADEKKREDGPEVFWEAVALSGFPPSQGTHSSETGMDYYFAESRERNSLRRV